MKYKLKSSNDELMKLAILADEEYTPLHLNESEEIPNEQNEINVDNWKTKILHGKFPKLLDEYNIDKEATLHWLKEGYLYPETEGFVIAIQDRVIRTKNYERHILKMATVDKCRKCGMSGESIEHIMCGCSALSNSAYLGRHNQMAKLIHQQLGKKLGMLDKDTPRTINTTETQLLKTRIIYCIGTDQ
jgi:hypothetical protein